MKKIVLIIILLGTYAQAGTWDIGAVQETGATDIGAVQAAAEEPAVGGQVIIISSIPLIFIIGFCLMRRRNGQTD